MKTKQQKIPNMKDKEKREKAWRIPRAISLEDKVNFRKFRT
jgi:hypothetical protein